jgi:hypothetical protein
MTLGSVLRGVPYTVSSSGTELSPGRLVKPVRSNVSSDGAGAVQRREPSSREVA